MEWISVLERLPENGLVLGYHPTHEGGPYYVLDFYGSKENQKWDVLNDSYPNTCNYSGFKPTHWMPLPNPPKTD